MDAKKRVVVNTLAQNIRSVLNVCLSLYATRIVLSLLGDDYGLYTLVAGVVALLGFVTNAMVISTQRYLSFLFGKNEMENARKVFSNSLMLQMAFGLFVILLFRLLEPVIFSSLNIPEGREEVVPTLFHIMLASLFFTFLVAPYRALFIARENIVYISIIDVLDGVLKLMLVFLLYKITFDLLLAYAFIMLGVILFSYLAFMLYSLWHYPESCFFPRKKDVDLSVLKGMSNFAGWTLYGTACIVGRAQGMQVVLNQFFAIAVNKAYGLSLQVLGAIQFIAVSVMNAMTPQIIKAEGRGDRQAMLALSILASKVAYLLLAIIVIPLVFEMPQVLQLWLGQVPEHIVTFSRFLLLASLVDQLSVGLGAANQAIGYIRNYTLLTFTIKLFTIVLAWVLFRYGFSIRMAMLGYLSIEFLCMLIRIPYLKRTAGLSVSGFVSKVFLRVLLPTCAMVFVCWLSLRMPAFPFRFLVTGIFSLCVSSPVIWFYGLGHRERQIVLSMVHLDK